MRRWEQGFSVIELLLGLALALCLALAIAPLITSTVSLGKGEADRVLQTVQARVACARFERDLRLAGPAGCPFAVSGALLAAGPTKVVVLAPTQGEPVPQLVEWEISGTNLMRRWGLCPSLRPSVFANSLFLDHKTMLEGVRAESRFVFSVGGREVAHALTEAQLERVDRVVLSLRATPVGESGVESIVTVARVGR